MPGEGISLESPWLGPVSCQVMRQGRVPQGGMSLDEPLEREHSGGISTFTLLPECSIILPAKTTTLLGLPRNLGNTT